MANNGIEVNMTPFHTGDFIHTEVIEGLELNVTRETEILGVHRATISSMLTGKDN